MYFLNLARARSFPRLILQKFVTILELSPRAQLPKSLLQFWDFHPEPNFPKFLLHFWDFSQIQTLGTFVLHFRYFEFTACVCRSFEFTIGSIWVHCRSVGLSVVFDTVSSECCARGGGSRTQFFQKSATILGLSGIQTQFALPPAQRRANLLLFWEFLFCVSVILNLPHASTALLNSL